MVVPGKKKKNQKPEPGFDSLVVKSKIFVWSQLEMCFYAEIRWENLKIWPKNQINIPLRRAKYREVTSKSRV